MAYGPRATLGAARVALWIVLRGGVALASAGWLPYVCLVALPLAVWVDAFVRRWSREDGGGDGSWATGFALRGLVSVIVVVALCLGDYAWRSENHLPVAGLGTAAGHPADRPRLAPWELRRWERTHGIIAPGAGRE